MFKVPRRVSGWCALSEQIVDEISVGTRKNPAGAEGILGIELGYVNITCETVIISELIKLVETRQNYAENIQ